MQQKYNGYTNWTRWNIALWINNDEALYSLASIAMRESSSIRKAADAILQSLQELGVTHTPDGAKFSRAAIIEAIRNWE